MARHRGVLDKRPTRPPATLADDHWTRTHHGVRLDCSTVVHRRVGELRMAGELFHRPVCGQVMLVSRAVRTAAAVTCEKCGPCKKCGPRDHYAESEIRTLDTKNAGRWVDDPVSGVHDDAANSQLAGVSLPVTGSGVETDGDLFRSVKNASGDAERSAATTAESGSNRGHPNCG